MEDPGSSKRHFEVKLPDIGLPYLGPIPAKVAPPVNESQVMTA